MSNPPMMRGDSISETCERCGGHRQLDVINNFRGSIDDPYGVTLQSVLRCPNVCTDPTVCFSELFPRGVRAERLKLPPTCEWEGFAHAAQPGPLYGRPMMRAALQLLDWIAAVARRCRGLTPIP